MGAKRPCPHTRWRVKHTKKGVYRICRNRNCKMKILMMPSGMGKSPLEEEYKVRRPKGKHRSTFERESKSFLD